MGLYINLVVLILEHIQALVKNNQNCTKFPILPLILTFGVFFMFYDSFATHDHGGTIENLCCMYKTRFLDISMALAMLFRK